MNNGERIHVLHILHGGKFDESPFLDYVEGVETVQEVDPDLMSIIEIEDILHGFGYKPTEYKCFYTSPDAVFQDELKKLTTDQDVLDMFAYHIGVTDVYLYIEHLTHFNGEQLTHIEHNKGKEKVVQEVPDLNVPFSNRKRVLSEEADIEDGLSDIGSDFGSEDNSEADDSADSDYVAFGADDKLLSETESEDSVEKEGKEKKGGDGNYEEEKSDDEILRSPYNSDDDVDKIEYPVFNEKTDMKNIKLKLGLTFTNIKKFRKALRMHSIKKGYEYMYKKNDSDRVTVVCKKNCGWRLHASQVHGTSTFQIKSLKGDPHSCGRTYNNSSATSTWLAEQYMEKLADNPTWKVTSMKKSVKREFMLDVSESQIYRAKKKALQVIEGSHKEQYARLWDYCATVRRHNEGTVALIKVDRPIPNEAPIFMRVFIMYNAQRVGLLSGCRPIIGLDGCHLKGPCGGQLLSAVGMDANNQMFPIAIAVVEAECKDSWMWFLEALVDVIGSPEDHGWTFISDRQKGLVESFNTLLPRADHRFCARHLYANFKEKFKGQELKDLVWAAASSYTLVGWQESMNEIRLLDKEAFDWLSEINPTLWCRSHFSTRTKCDMISNNISESFNQYIKECRDKPIITLLEMIRKQMMIRFQKRRENISQYQERVCPKIIKIVEETKELAKDCEVIYAGQGEFEVTYLTRTDNVNLNERTCSCREWDMIGIPCVHAVAAIITHNTDVYDYVHEFYHRDAWARAYEAMVYPLPDQSMWVTTQFDPIMPPPLRRPPGRPKKARRKAADELKNPFSVRKSYSSLRCKNCGEYGHNIRTCKGPVKAKRVAGTGRGKGRPPLGRGVGTTEAGNRAPSGGGRGRARAPTQAGRGRATTQAGRGRGTTQAGRGRGTTQAGRGRGTTQAGRGRGITQATAAVTTTRTGRGATPTWDASTGIVRGSNISGGSEQWRVLSSG